MRLLLNAVIVEPFSSSVTDTSSDVADALVTVPHCPFRDPFLMFVSAILVPGRIDGRDAKPRSAATPRVARSRHRIARDSFAANTKPTAAPEAYRFSADGDESSKNKMAISANDAISAGTSMNPKNETRPRAPAAKSARARYVLSAKTRPPHPLKHESPNPNAYVALIAATAFVIAPNTSAVSYTHLTLPTNREV